MTAEISPCGQYRYTLTRVTDVLPLERHTMLFIMLNPSTADALQDDPTIRRCISFARRENCTDLTVVNLFALRATDPKELLTHADPVGPLNDERIAEMVAKHEIIVAAWGAHPFAKKRAQNLLNKFGPFKCLGTTKDGSPRHPLYVRNDTVLTNMGGT